MELERFVRMIPGGVYMMWSLFEAENYEELLDTAERLERHAFRLGIPQISDFSKQLGTVVREEQGESALRETLEALIGAFIGLCEAD